MSKRTIATYVRLKHDERIPWEIDIPYKVLKISVRVVGVQSTKPQDYNEDDPTLDEEDLELMDEIEEEAPKQEVVETLLLLGNDKTGHLDWFHSSEVIFIS